MWMLLILQKFITLISFCSSQNMFFEDRIKHIPRFSLSKCKKSCSYIPFPQCALPCSAQLSLGCLEFSDWVLYMLILCHYSLTLAEACSFCQQLCLSLYLPNIQGNVQPQNLIHFSKDIPILSIYIHTLFLWENLYDNANISSQVGQ